jgi:hypothetical protein
VANLINETAAARRIRLFVFFSKLGRVVGLVVGSRIGSTSIPKSDQKKVWVETRWDPSPQKAYKKLSRSDGGRSQIGC